MSEQIHLAFIKNTPDEKLELIGDTDGTYLLKRWVPGRTTTILLTVEDLTALGEVLLRVLTVELRV